MQERERACVCVYVYVCGQAEGVASLCVEWEVRSTCHPRRFQRQTGAGGHAELQIDPQGTPFSVNKGGPLCKVLTHRPRLRDPFTSAGAAPAPTQVPSCRKSFPVPLAPVYSSWLSQAFCSTHACLRRRSCLLSFAFLGLRGRPCLNVKVTSERPNGQGSQNVDWLLEI